MLEIGLRNGCHRFEFSRRSSPQSGQCAIGPSARSSRYIGARSRLADRDGQVLTLNERARKFLALYGLNGHAPLNILGDLLQVEPREQIASGLGNMRRGTWFATRAEAKP